jgi:hypothetical protein
LTVCTSLTLKHFLSHIHFHSSFNLNPTRARGSQQQAPETAARVSIHPVSSNHDLRFARPMNYDILRWLPYHEPYSAASVCLFNYLDNFD